MRHMNTSAYSGPLILSIFLLASTALHAQATPAAGTSVSVKMLDAVDSGNDAAGKQYRASVTRPVDAGNGVTIAQGAAATVTLTSSGSGYVAQLTSVTINGQQVTVTSNSASVNSAAQSAAGSTAASAVNSVLGGFGHRVSAPASVAAVAMGQHVSLPTGTTLTFVLGESPAAPTAPSAPAAPAVETASAAPASSPASEYGTTSGATAGGPLTGMYICHSNPPPFPSDPNYGKMYLTAAFEVPVATEGSIPVLEPAFSAYLKATYQYGAGIQCIPIWTIVGAQQAQASIAGIHGEAKLIDTGWRYGQPPLAPGQSGFDPLAPGGIDLSQHRQTTYFCTLQAAGGTTWAAPNPYNAQLATKYVSSVFQADWDSVAVSNAWYAYIRDHYVHDLDQTINGGTFGSGSNLCLAQSPPFATMGHQSAMVGSKTVQHIVPVDFTDTPAQAAAGNVVGAQAAAATQAAAAQTAAATFFISCSTSGNAGVDTYYTGVFEIGAKPGRSPHPPNTPGAYIGGTWMVPADLSQKVLDHFYAYLTQKGYKFSPGSSSACDVRPTEAEAKAAHHKRAYEGGGCSTCGKVVETGWKDTP